MTFEEYWKANVLFRLRGVMGLSDKQIENIKKICKDCWKEGAMELAARFCDNK